ncbi:hypothetical protein Tco_0513866 [Tanacetum coccineum]
MNSARVVIVTLLRAASVATNARQRKGKLHGIFSATSFTSLDKQDTSSMSRNDVDTEDAVIRPVNDQAPLAEVNSNTTPDSAHMSHKGGEIDQNAEKCQVSCPLLEPSFDNMATKFSNQSLESENISLRKTVAKLQKDFSRMEAHCVNMELKYQNQALKDGQMVKF